MKTYAVVNSKGGVGKTTVAVNLGHALSLAGKKVLVVDTDIQDNVAVWLDVVSNELTLFDVLIEGENIKKTIVNARNNLDVVPGGGDNLGAVPYFLNQRGAPVSILKDALSELKDEYDYCLIDCSPSRSLIHTLSIVASDGIFVPVNMEWLGVFGSSQVSKAVNQVVEKYNLDTEIKLIIPTFLDRRRSKICDDILDDLKKYYKDKISSPIRINSKLSEAPGYAETVFELKDKKGVEDFETLRERVFDIG